MVEVIIRSLFLGVALAMDAFAVSASNGLKENKMKFSKAFLIAFTFGLFQGVMPFIGYLFGHALIDYIGKAIPWIALLLLSFLGIKMIIDGVKLKKEVDDDKANESGKLTFKVLMIQAVATSIDALSTGLTFSDYTLLYAIICVLIIAVVTLLISLSGVYIGKKFGTMLENKADIVGGIILIAIGLEIFITGMIG